MKTIRILSILFIFIFTIRNGLAQKEGLYYSGGISFNVGTKINRIGASFLFGGFTDFFQSNIGLRAYYNFRTYGPSCRGMELKAHLSALIGYGRLKDTNSMVFYSSISNHTLYKNSAAFSYIYYFDTQRTSQASGLLCLEFGNFKVMQENDLFGKAAADKYRTAAVKFVYTDSLFRFAINTEMWTGKSKGQPQIKGTDYPARKGYIDMSEADFGKYSNGILSFQLDYALPYRQVARGEVGMDSEKVRHTLQNQIIHDWIFIPKNWLKPVSYNLHIPMLDTHAEPYLYKEGQEVEKAEFFINFSGNPGEFY